MTANEHHILGDDYYYGRNSMPKDDNLAYINWKFAAEMGNVQCMENMAWAYRDGIGVKANSFMEEAWTEKHAEATTYFSDPQIRQDRWVEFVHGGKHNGYFVEVGASGGMHSSNCYMLEKRLDWQGICIEPNPKFFKELVRNRRVPCIQSPVAPEEKEVIFRLADYYGGIEDNLAEWHKDDWDYAPTVTMTTRRLEDILDECKAPPVIDYLSLDIEGGEADIIESFPFDRYRVLTMTVEKSEDRVVDSILNAGFVIIPNRFSDTTVDWEIHCVHESFKL